MDRKQEEKFDAWTRRMGDMGLLDRVALKSAWMACLEANGIGEERTADYDFFNREDFEIERSQGGVFIRAKYGTNSMTVRLTDNQAKMIARFVLPAVVVAQEVPRESNLADGVFRIGEKVEFKDSGEWYPGDVAVFGQKGFRVSSHAEVRRIPAWKPKDGEAVLFPMEKLDSGEVHGKIIAYSAIWKGGFLYFGDHKLRYSDKMIPFDEEKRGKPWSEIV